MALFEMILKSVYQGQQCVTRWNYLSSGTPAASSLSFLLAKAGGFIAAGEPPVFPTGTIFGKIRQISDDGVEFNEIICNNVYELSDFYTIAFPDNTNGLQSGEGAPSFVAAGFRTNLVTRAVARGTKRFPGVPAGAIINGGVLAGNYIADMQILAAAMTENLTISDEGNAITFSPIIVSKKKPTTPPVTKSYAYYPTLQEQLAHSASGILWEVYDTPRSQVSRQRGHGK